MTPIEAADHLHARRTDAPQPYALNDTAMLLGQLEAAWAAAATHAEEHATMPPHVEQAITNALKEIQ